MIESGTVLQGRFLIEDRIGEGGMGAVYRAVDQKFGTRVAIKETFYGNEELAAAFEREARLLNGLHHPIFPHVSDYFSDRTGHFLVMEYIEGEDLSTLLKRGEVFSVDEVMRWTLDLLDGLDYLHSQDPPVIHRDIKPNNLKLTSRGNIVLLDFGMAKETSGNTLGMKSVFGYSRRYSPLEQIEGTGTDTRSDIFSLGATVFHLLTGKPPVDVLARASAIVGGKPDPLQLASDLRPDVPDSVAAIINSALSLNPDQRFVSARAMWNALEYAIGLDFGEHTTRRTAPETVAIASAVGVSGGDEFAALDAYRNDTERSLPDEAGAVPLMVNEDAAAAERASNASEEVHDADVTMPRSPDYVDDRPIDRAVIHLDAVDGEYGDPDRLGGETEVIDNKDSARPVPVAATGRQPGINEYLSRPVVWVPILLIVAVLALVGLFGDADEPQVQGIDTTAANEMVPANAAANAETGAVAGTEAPEETDVAVSGQETSDELNSGSEAAPEGSDTNEEPKPSAPEPRGSRANASRDDQPRDEREIEDAETEDEAETDRGERRDPPERSSPQQMRRQRAGGERPRVVPPWQEPSVVTIETILTGIPYERRRHRDETDWMTKDEEREFRRRLKRLRRQSRDDRPPF